MRFKFGKSYIEKEEIREAKKQWHHWYAWHPVRLNDRGPFVWLEYVQRKGYEGTTGMTEPPYLCYNYKEADELVKFIK